MALLEVDYSIQNQLRSTLNSMWHLTEVSVKLQCFSLRSSTSDWCRFFYMRALIQARPTPTTSTLSTTYWGNTYTTMIHWHWEGLASISPPTSQPWGWFATPWIWVRWGMSFRCIRSPASGGSFAERNAQCTGCCRIIVVLEYGDWNMLVGSSFGEH